MNGKWTEGSWDSEGNSLGLPDETTADGEFQYVWVVVRLKKCWGTVDCCKVHSAKVLLRSSSAYSKAVNEPPPRWFWQLAPNAPQPPPDLPANAGA